MFFSFFIHLSVCSSIGWFLLFYLPDHLFVLLRHLVFYSFIFISVIELSNIYWLTCIASSTLRHWYAILSKIFSQFFSIFITYFLNLGSSRQVRSVLLFVLSGDFSCSFNGEKFLWFFILLFYQFISNIYHGHEGVFLCGSISVQNVWVQYFCSKDCLLYECHPHLSSEPSGNYLLHRGCDWCGVQSLCCINIWGWAFSLLCGCQRQGLLPSCWRMSLKSQIWSASIVLEWVICPKGSDCWSKWNPYSHNEPMEDLYIYSWQFSKAVQITSLPLVFIPDDKAVVWSRLKLGTRALWRQEPKWPCWRCGPVSLALPGPVCPRPGAKL